MLSEQSSLRNEPFRLVSEFRVFSEGMLFSARGGKQAEDEN
jgi:hypothetical protein